MDSSFQQVRRACVAGKRLLQVVVSLVVCYLCTQRVLLAETPCIPLGQDIPVRTALASAGFFANLRNAEHSIRSRMDQLMEEARISARSIASSKERCKRACVTTPAVAVVFKSTPNLYRSDYDGAAACAALEESTTKEPIVYRSRRFSSEEDARTWYNDLTQGDGPDGKDLYRRCPGACSPSYESVIYRDGVELVVSTTIVCGHARDKDDDQYRLSAGVRWICDSAR